MSEVKEVSKEVQEKVAQMINTVKGLGERDIDAKNQFADSTKTVGADIRKKVSYQSELLSAPMNAIMNKNSEGGDLASSMLTLRSNVEIANPNNYNLATGGLRRLLSKLPGVGTKLEAWYAKYQTVATVIDDILNGLEAGKQTLIKDNVTIRHDRDSLMKYIYMLQDQLEESMLLDTELGKLVDSGDMEDKKFIEEDVLYYLRQEIQDMQLSLGSSNQAILVSDIISKSNEELIRSTDRTLNVTSIAIKSAAGMEIALSHQKKQMDAVLATNSMTTDLMKSTAKKAKTQGVEIVQQANNITAQIEGMKEAFTDCLEAMDILDNYKKEALPKMAENISTLDGLNKQMKENIDRN